MSRDYNGSTELTLFCEPEIFPGDDVRLIARGALINIENVEAIIDSCELAVDRAFARAGFEVTA